MNKVFGPTPVNSGAPKTNYLLIGLSVSIVLIVGVLVYQEIDRRNKKEIIKKR
ncbi:MAG: hypothetical protein NT150_02130 [Bacteroidetes bacterium]|nr:hypothetical protein [Bacteroidota bacterium]